MSQSKRSCTATSDLNYEAFEFLVSQSKQELVKANWKRQLDSLPDRKPQKELNLLSKIDVGLIGNWLLLGVAMLV